MRVAHLLAIGDELMGQLTIVQPAVMSVRPALPTAQVYFIDANWLLELIRVGPSIHPLVVVPRKAVEIGDDRGRTRRQLRREAVGIALVERFTECPADAVLVFLAR